MRKATAPRLLGFWMCTALVVGNMVGSGVFLLPAALAPYGWNAVFGWMLTIAGGLCLAWVFSTLARVLPRGGGPYAFTRAAFGPAAAFIVAWSYWVAAWSGNAAIATGAVSYLSVFFPEIGDTQGLHAGVACAIIWVLTAVNCRGAFLAGGVQLITTILKLLPLLAVMGIAAFVLLVDGSAAVAGPPFRPGSLEISSVTAAATLTLWALLGLESATVPAEKVRDPARTIPRATMTGVLVTGFVYLFTCSAIMLLAPAEEIAASSAPFSDFASRFFDSRAGALVAVFAMISGFGALNGWILIQGEIAYAMAKDGVFPRELAKTSRRNVPVRAHLLSSILLTIVVLMNYTKSMTDAFTFVLLLSTTAMLVMYLACSLAALVLQWKNIAPGSPVFSAIAVAAAIYSVWTIYGAGGEAVFWGLVLLAGGAPVYFLVRWRERNAKDQRPISV